MSKEPSCKLVEIYQHILQNMMIDIQLQGVKLRGWMMKLARSALLQWIDEMKL